MQDQRLFSPYTLFMLLLMKEHMDTFITIHTEFIELKITLLERLHLKIFSYFLTLYLKWWNVLKLIYRHIIWIHCYQQKQLKNWIDISSGPIDTPDVASHCTALRCNRRSLHVPSTIFESYQHLNLFLILNDTRCCIALHPQSCIALHCIALHCSPRVALHCMIPDVALHCIAAPELHCIALQPQISPCSLSCIHQYLNLINIWNSFISDWHYLQKSLTVSTSSTFVQMRINIFKKSLTL